MKGDAQAVVHVVDDDEAVRDSLRMLLASVGHHVKTYASALEFLDGSMTPGPGCLVLDIRMPGMSGLDLQLELGRRGNRLPVIFITGHGDIPMAVQTMQRGATDFIQKPFRDQELLDVIQAALDTSRDEGHDDDAREAVAARLSALTPREREVMEAVVAGKANKIIAYDLGISQRTVELHRAKVMEKMEAGSLAGLVKLVLTKDA